MSEQLSQAILSVEEAQAEGWQPVDLRQPVEGRWDGVESVALTARPSETKADAIDITIKDVGKPYEETHTMVFKNCVQLLRHPEKAGAYRFVRRRVSGHLEVVAIALGAAGVIGVAAARKYLSHPQKNS